MAILGTIIFKPKYDIGITRGIIEKFTQEWLRWEDTGAYIAWSNDRHYQTTERRLPEGYFRIDIEMDSGCLEDFTEICWCEETISAAHLTDDMFILLVEEGFFEDPEDYHFYERELTEVLSTLSANDSRLLSFWGDQSFVSQKEKDGSIKCRTNQLASLMLNTAF